MSELEEIIKRLESCIESTKDFKLSRREMRMVLVILTNYYNLSLEKDKSCGKL